MICWDEQLWPRGQVHTPEVHFWRSALDHVQHSTAPAPHSTSTAQHRTVNIVLLSSVSTAGLSSTMSMMVTISLQSWHCCRFRTACSTSRDLGWDACAHTSAVCGQVMLIATKCQQCRLKGRSCGTSWKRRQCGNGSWTPRGHQANPSKTLRRTMIMIR